MTAINIYPNTKVYTFSLGVLSPLIWTRASANVVIGNQASLEPLDSGWTIQGTTRDDLGGGVFRFTADTTNTLHRTYRVPTNPWTVELPCEYSIRLKKEAGSDCNRIRINTAASLISLNLDTGVADGDAFIESFSSKYIDDGWWELSVRATKGAYNVAAWGLSMYDPGGTLLTWNATGVDGRILAQSPTYTQQGVAQWGDMRNPGGVYWEQGTAARQPVLWRDSVGQCLAYGGAQYMTCDSLAGSFSGDDVPISMAVACDNVSIGAAARSVIGLGRTTVGDFHVLHYPASAVAAKCFRRGNLDTTYGVPYAASPNESQAAAIDVYDGSTRYLKFANRTELSDIINTAEATYDRMAIGALLLAVPAQYFIGRMREAAIGTGAWNLTQRTKAHSHLTAKYGY